MAAVPPARRRKALFDVVHRGGRRPTLVGRREGSRDVRWAGEPASGVLRGDGFDLLVVVAAGRGVPKIAPGHPPPGPAPPASGFPRPPVPPVVLVPVRRA